jgi:hypothetical protein|tara:strand:- start:190 stop:459 length:270 start_codon:yes stop_codon:yes gene_type:complete
MSNSETQSDYKIIETKINLMEDMLDGYIENNSNLTAKEMTEKNTMPLNKALELVLEMAENGRVDYRPDLYYKSKYDTAIAKVKHFNKQL